MLATGNDRFQMDELYLEMQRDSGLIDFPSIKNPYPGLRPFRTSEYPLFFGREKLETELLALFRRSRFLPVLGASGSGKSSLIRAGLLPTLYNQQFDEPSINWNVAICRPGSSPIDNLAYSLSYATQKGTVIDPRSPDVLDQYQVFARDIRTNSEKVVDHLHKLDDADGNQKFLVIVDQFEELFRFKTEIDTSLLDESSHFVDTLLRIANSEKLKHCYVVMTMRSEFLGDCVKFRGLPEEINKSLFLVPRLNTQQLKRAIEKPALVMGAKISPALTNELLGEVDEDMDQLPILQHALSRTFSVWKESDNENQNLIEVSDYEHPRVGGMKASLDRHASEIMAEEGSYDYNLTRILFQQITDRAKGDKGIRRPMRLEEIVDACKVLVDGKFDYDRQEKRLIKIIDSFRQEEASFLMPPLGIELNKDSIIDISHESLMRIWEELEKWIEKEARDAKRYLRIQDRRNQFLEDEENGLITKPHLPLLVDWKKNQKPILEWARKYNDPKERAALVEQYEEELKGKEITIELKRELTGKADKKIFDDNFDFLAKSERKAESKRLWRERGIAAVVLFLLAATFFSAYSFIIAEEGREAALIAEGVAIAAEEEAYRQREIAVEEAKAAKAAKDDADSSRNEADYQRKLALDAFEAEKAAYRIAEEARLLLLRSNAELKDQRLALDSTTFVVLQQEIEKHLSEAQVYSQQPASRLELASLFRAKNLINQPEFQKNKRQKNQIDKYNTRIDSLLDVAVQSGIVQQGKSLGRIQEVKLVGERLILLLESGDVYIIDLPNNRIIGQIRIAGLLKENNMDSLSYDIVRSEYKLFNLKSNSVDLFFKVDYNIKSRPLLDEQSVNKRRPPIDRKTKVKSFRIDLNGGKPEQIEDHTRDFEYMTYYKFVGNRMLKVDQAGSKRKFPQFWRHNYFYKLQQYDVDKQEYGEATSISSDTYYLFYFNLPTVTIDGDNLMVNRYGEFWKFTGSDFISTSCFTDQIDPGARVNLNNSKYSFSYNEAVNYSFGSSSDDAFLLDSEMGCLPNDAPILEASGDRHFLQLSTKRLQIPKKLPISIREGIFADFLDQNNLIIVTRNGYYIWNFSESQDGDSNLDVMRILGTRYWRIGEANYSEKAQFNLE